MTDKNNAPEKKSQEFSINEAGKLVCGYCSEEIGTPLKLEAHVASHIRNGDKLIEEKDPNTMSLSEKQKFLMRVYEDDQIRQRLADKAVLKTLSDVCKDRMQPRELYVPELNAKIAWRPMTGADYLELSEITKDIEYRQAYVYHNLKRDNKGWTLKKTQNDMAPHVVDGIFNAIMRELDFLVISPLQEVLEKAHSS